MSSPTSTPYEEQNPDVPEPDVNDLEEEGDVGQGEFDLTEERTREKESLERDANRD
jgi:hypothetical protein